MEDYKIIEAKKGYWYYDHLVKMGVVIVAIHYNPELAMFDESDCDDQAPVLNKNGKSFMIYWHDAEFKISQTHTSGGISLEEAIERAEGLVGKKIEWINENK
jgi:hypothetical protein